jgi:hypothetical protein
VAKNRTRATTGAVMGARAAARCASLATMTGLRSSAGPLPAPHLEQDRESERPKVPSAIRTMVLIEY